jgi:hypothetical protein
VMSSEMSDSDDSDFHNLLYGDDRDIRSVRFAQQLLPVDH